MNKELLTLYGARHAVFQIMAKGSCDFAKRLEDGTWEKIGWNDICYLLTDMIDKFKDERSKNILDKIRTEIIEVYCDRPHTYDHPQRTELYSEVMKIINKYKSESEEKE